MTLAAPALGQIGLMLLCSNVPGASQDRQAQGEAPAGQGGRKATPALVELPPDYVRFIRVPEGGVQPRLEIDARGRVALLFFRGDGTGGDLYLARSSDEAATFAPAVQVNSRPRSVSAPEGVHMASLALGSDGRAHVAWVSTDSPPALHYAREKPDSGFEAALNLGSPAGLGSSAAVAVDGEGQVYVFFAALETQVVEGEAPRHDLLMMRSPDGVTFSDATSIEKEKFSVSEHSALSAHVDATEGTLLILYRAYFLGAKGNTHGRDMRLVSSENRGETFKSAMVDNWKTRRDPRSLSHLFQDQTTTLAAFEGRGQVFWSPVKRSSNKVSLPLEPGPDEEAWRSSAVVAANRKNEVLLSWLERPAKDPAGPSTIRWQVWQKDTRGPLGRGRAPEPAGSSCPAALARADGGFTIVF